VATRSRNDRTQVTLARALSKLGICSRSQARARILEGKVRVGGKTVLDPDLWIDLRHEMPEVEGAGGGTRRRVYYAFHKPWGVVTTRKDERGRKTVYDLLPAGIPVVFPVGRLDRESTGLLLFTNDGGFGERITGPEMGVAKTYLLTLDRPLEPDDQQRMESPMVLPDGLRVRGAKVRRAGRNGARYEITITEGKNRQIRRICEKLGYGVVALHRLRIGTIRLGVLPEGELRPLTAEEVLSFQRTERRTI
jgi:23S rRNA pseudouridine2605 synthase